MHQVVEIEEKDVIQKNELFANYLSQTDLKRNLKKEYERIDPFLANQPLLYVTWKKLLQFQKLTTPIDPA